MYFGRYYSVPIIQLIISSLAEVSWSGSPSAVEIGWAPPIPEAIILVASAA
jgi:hypothetical protein